MIDRFFESRRNLLKNLALTSTLFLFESVGANVFAKTPSKKRDRNPIFPGRNADPEVLFSQKTGRVYVYPTSEANGFKAFSTQNLVDWRDEGLVLPGKNVSWAKSMFWAPSIVEKKIDGKFKYFLYFCAEEKIGVAVGDDPLGPFVDSGAPLLDADSRPEGVRGVEIDPFVFCDPVGGKNYLFWGNSYLAVCELDDEMVSLKRETMQVVTPPNFFEGTCVFYRNGLYYLTWSKNDTRSVDYQVWVATSKSPTGPFVSPKENAIILQKAPEKEIFGPGHHSFLFLPNGERFIFYHRLCLPIGANPWARETCVDRFEFDDDGSIRPIVPTREGISTPVDWKRTR